MIIICNQEEEILKNNLIAFVCNIEANSGA
jgi:hypothetical protein